MTALAMLVALGIEWVFDWPDRIFAKIGHPVTWLGKVVDWFDRDLNRDQDAPRVRRAMGGLALIAVVGIAVVAGWVATEIAPDGVIGAALVGILAWPLVAARGLDTHVRAVEAPLAQGNLEGARQAVSMIVGRDVAALDEAGVARAALESLAENTSDGVVAPLFWGLLLGLPGIAAYKAINTLDSMIGHKTPEHRDFGWASARLDDLVNLIPARLTGVVFALISGRVRAALEVMWRDARLHRSPNAGWPEAALAAGLGVRLSGPRIYADGIVDEPWVNGDMPDPGATDIALGLGLYRRLLLVIAAGLAMMTLI